MTTYIKRFSTIEIDSSSEYEEAIKEELEYIEDVADTLLAIAENMDDRDFDAEFYDEIRSLRRLSMGLEDMSNNLGKLIDGYTIKLADAIPGPGE